MSVMFLINVVLALILAGARGRMSMLGLLGGFLVGYVLLWIARPIFRRDDYFPRMAAVVMFLLAFVRELVTATWAIALAVLFRRRANMHPNILTYDVSGMERWEILILSHCITLTPGTTTVDISGDLSTLYVHAFDAEDPEAVRRDLDRGLKNPLLRWSRPPHA